MKSSQVYMGILIATVTGCAADDDDKLPDRERAFVRALDTAMYECPDRVWSGLADSYRGVQVLAVVPSSHTAYLWNDQSAPEKDRPAVTILSSDALDEAWLGTYNFGDFQEHPTLGISLDATAAIDKMLEEQSGRHRWFSVAEAAAFHEGFHAYSVQQTWNVSTAGRTPSYPADADPRVLRVAQVAAMRDLALGAGGPGRGGAAAFLARYGNTQPDEQMTLRGTDIIEGSAEYANARSQALAALGCAATDAELTAAIAEHLDDYASIQNTLKGGDTESYSLGVVAGLAVAPEQLAAWQAQVGGGASPLEAALAGVTPIDTTVDAGLEAQVRMAVADDNTAVGAEVAAMQARMADPALVRVAASEEWYSGSYNAASFRFLRDEPAHRNFAVKLVAVLAPGPNDQFEVHGQTTFTDTETPCPGVTTGLAVTLPSSALAENAGTVTSSDAAVTFAGLHATRATDANGLPWLCPVSRPR